MGEGVKAGFLEGFLKDFSWGRVLKQGFCFIAWAGLELDTLPSLQNTEITGVWQLLPESEGFFKTGKG